MNKPIINATDPRFAKASASGAGNDCVEVRFGAVAVRDTKNTSAVLNLDLVGGQALLNFAKRFSA